MRDAALIRQEQQGGALVIAGHTRTTEVERLVEVGWFEQLAPARTRHPRVVATAQHDCRRPARRAGAHPVDRLAHGDRGREDRPRARAGGAPGLCARTALRRLRRGGPLPALRRSAAAATIRGAAELHLVRRHRDARGAARTARARSSARRGREPAARRRTSGARSRASRSSSPTGTAPCSTSTSRPALVIATRGAEPLAAGGYRAVLLLDGERMVARESLRVGEDVLRWWSDAAALAADDATVVLVGVGGAVASALATWSPARLRPR